MSSKTSNSLEGGTSRFIGNRAHRMAAALFLAVLVANILFGQEPPENEPLAYVGDEPITTADVDFQLGRTSQSPPPPELAPAIRGATVFLIAHQRQSLQTLRRLGLAASVDEVDGWIASHPVGTGQAAGIDESAIREVIAFRLSWKRYLAKHLTAANVERHFKNQKRRFNGTLFTISIGSIAASPGESPSRREAVEQLQAVRRRVVDNAVELSTALASEANAEVSLQRQVRGTGDLDPLLVDGLLQLNDGELSEPIHSATAVHLIQLVDSAPGTRPVEEVESEVRAHLLIFLLEHLAKQSSAELPLRSPE